MVDETAGFADAPVLFLVLGLVVVTKRHSSAFTAGNGPGIARVGYEYFSVSDEADVSGATGVDFAD